MSNEIKQAELLRQQLQPDGWCAFRDGKLVTGEYSGVIALYRREWERDCFADKGYEVKPVCLIDPQELERLRALEKWSEDAIGYIEAMAEIDKTSNDTELGLIETYRAIPTKEADK